MKKYNNNNNNNNDNNNNNQIVINLSGQWKQHIIKKINISSEKDDKSMNLVLKF